MRRLDADALRRYLEGDGTRTGGFAGAPVPRLAEADPAGPSLALLYDVPEWMVNPWGVVHGGLTAALMDTAMGILTCWAADGAICPTVSMQTNFLHPVRAGQALRVEVTMEHFGGATACVSARCLQNGRVTTTASGIYSTATPRRRISGLAGKGEEG